MDRNWSTASRPVGALCNICNLKSCAREGGGEDEGGFLPLPKKIWYERCQGRFTRREKRPQGGCGVGGEVSYNRGLPPHPHPHHPTHYTGSRRDIKRG